MTAAATGDRTADTAAAAKSVAAKTVTARTAHLDVDSGRAQGCSRPRPYQGGKRA